MNMKDLNLLTISNPKSHNNALLSLLLIFIIAPLASSQYPLVNYYCLNDDGNYTINSTYQNNLKSLFPIVVNQSSIANFGNSSIGEGIDKVYMIYNCRGDLNSEQCHECIKLAAQSITQKCPTQKESIVWYRECMIRYANRSIFSVEEEKYQVWDYDPGEDVNPRLPTTVAYNVKGLIEQAAYNETRRGYATGHANIAVNDDLYFLVQCTPDILGSRCERCLRAALRSIAGCCGTTKISFMMFFPSCQIRYDRSPFIRDGSYSVLSVPTLPSSPSPPIKGKSSAKTVKFDWISSALGLMLVVNIMLVNFI